MQESTSDIKAPIIEIDSREVTRQVCEGLKRVAQAPAALVVTVPCPQVDILHWLRARTTVPKTYWASRDGELEVGGLGASIVVSTRDPDAVYEQYEAVSGILAASPPSPHLQFFGGACFDPRCPAREPWAAYPAFWYVLPEFLIHRQGDEYFISVTAQASNETTVDDMAAALYTRLSKIELNGAALPDGAFPAIKSRLDEPGPGGWAGNIDRSLAEIDSGVIDKVVMARKTSLEFDGELDWYRVLTALKAGNSDCFAFMVQPARGSVFLGATPERLFRVERSRLLSEAVSGTIPRGGSPKADAEIGRRLLNSDKDLREHQFVAEALKEAFADLCEAVSIQPRPELMKLANVQHLCTGISGRLKDDVTHRHIVEMMHPTPAVGGTPRSAALDLIAEAEPFDRGWYAGPVGVISQTWSEVVVAIRSMLLGPRRAHLYVGAGIVPGSEAGAEWDELESKVSIAMNILGGMSA